MEVGLAANGCLALGSNPHPHPRSFPMLGTKTRMEPESRLESQTFEQGSTSPGDGAGGGAR